MDILTKGTTGTGNHFEGLLTLEEYEALSFLPESKTEIYLPLRVKGYSYGTKKKNARQLAYDVKKALPDLSLSEDEKFLVADFFRTIGGRFHLVTEFQVIGILDERSK